MKEILVFIERYLPVVLVVGLLLELVVYWWGWDFPSDGVLLTIVLVGLVPFVIEMVRDLWKGNFGVDLIAVAGILAGVFIGEYAAAGLILLMLSGGELLEDYAIKKAKKEVSDLINRAPRIAHLWQEGQLQDVPVEAVQIGTLVLVKPNEIIPLDGVVIEGISMVDESSLTGESIPVAKGVHSNVYGGTVNSEGILRIRTLVTSDHTKYAQILQLIKQAEENKAPFVRMADRYSVVFTAITFGIAGAAWWFSGDVTRALAVLVVATPCPLILATPAAFAAGISQAAKRGIIVKDAGALEKLAVAQVMLFDKTGTVTLGTPVIDEVVVVTGERKQLLQYAASLEQYSVHVLAKAFMSFAGEEKVGVLEVGEYREELGKGLVGVIEGVHVGLGNSELMTSFGIAVSDEVLADIERRKEQGVMSVFLAVGDQIAAIFHISDLVRPELKEFFTSLHKEIPKIVLVTGDKQSVAMKVATLAGIDTVKAECLPADKVAVVKEYKQLGDAVVMVGDGVNDAPALASADVGIAMGGKESNAASGAGDIVIMVSGLESVREILLISRRVIMIAKQSIFVGIGLSVVLMVVSSFGYVKPVYGAFLQEVIDVIVILNALRARTTSFAR